MNAARYAISDNVLGSPPRQTSSDLERSAHENCAVNARHQSHVCVCHCVRKSALYTSEPNGGRRSVQIGRSVAHLVLQATRVRSLFCSTGSGLPINHRLLGVCARTMGENVFYFGIKFGAVYLGPNKLLIDPIDQRSRSCSIDEEEGPLRKLCVCVCRVVFYGMLYACFFVRSMRTFRTVVDAIEDGYSPRFGSARAQRPYLRCSLARSDHNNAAKINDSSDSAGTGDAPN